MPLLFPSMRGGVELFDEFFESGMEESISPFLTSYSRRWGKNLLLKSSLIAAFFLFFAFLLSFFPEQRSTSNLLLIFTYFFAGIPALISSLEDIVDLEINIDVLMTLAAFSSILIGSSKEGALLLVLFSFSSSMEEAVRTKAKGAISALKQLAPAKAHVVKPDGNLILRAIQDIKVGSKIHVKAGEIIPLDGKVIEGTSSVNLVHLTGESLPLTRSVGDTVPAGAHNLEGALTLTITHTSTDSTLARIIQLITQAQETKPKLQRWLDKAASRYAMAIIALSSLFAASLPLFFSIPYLGTEGSIYRALAFLIAASPCALIIAIPIAYLGAVSACASQGILLKGGIILDALAKCKTVAMDKTGTITTGELTCAGIDTFGLSELVLPLAYTLERSAVHPIAHAIDQYAKAKNIQPLPITDFQAVAGFGLQAIYQGDKVMIGHAPWILPKLSKEKQKIVHEAVSKRQAEGELVTVLCFRETIAIFHFRDTLRPHIVDTLKSLIKRWGLKVVMLTGDHQVSAKLIADQVGITEYYADLRPADKLKYISNEEHLAMVGDGINDAPALARANVGISMGKVGSSTAIDASDIVLLQDNIESLGWLISKSHQTVRIVKQNITIALTAIVFATIPALLGWIPLWLAVLLHEGGTAVVAVNALRLLRKRGM